MLSDAEQGAVSFNQCTGDLTTIPTVDTTGQLGVRIAILKICNITRRRATSGYTSRPWEQTDNDNGYFGLESRRSEALIGSTDAEHPIVVASRLRR